MSVCQIVPIAYFILIIFKSIMALGLVHWVIKLLMLSGGNKYIPFQYCMLYYLNILHS